MLNNCPEIGKSFIIKKTVLFAVHTDLYLVYYPFLKLKRCNYKMLKLSTKYCTRCKIEKDVSEFYPQIGGKNGLRAACKKCFIKANSEYRAKKKDGIRPGSKEYFLALKKRKKAAAIKRIYP